MNRLSAEERRADAPALAWAGASVTVIGGSVLRAI
jgi:hypothetical protein